MSWDILHGKYGLEVPQLWLPKLFFYCSSCHRIREWGFVPLRQFFFFFNFSSDFSHLEHFWVKNTKYAKLYSASTVELLSPIQSCALEQKLKKNNDKATSWQGTLPLWNCRITFLWICPWEILRANSLTCWYGQKLPRI